MREFKEGKIMYDKVETIGKGTVIQHGDVNKRIYLMSLDERDCPGIIQLLNDLARKTNYTKIFCKVPVWATPLFISNGFFVEAHIPGFYKGTADVFFVSKFLNSDRLMEIETDQLENLSRMLFDTDPKEDRDVKKQKKFRIRKLGNSDVDAITDLYREVFLSYPFPIHNPGYILKTMKDNVQYFGIEKKEELVAISSAEVDEQGKNAEMTDFATRPDYRGNNLSVRLLKRMQSEMKKQGIKTLYTIARLNSAAMNKTFLKFDYTYAGTLIKNTNIAGKIESMNVYYKHL
jgi:putative beta-lysine N-acetyltransferase